MRSVPEKRGIIPNSFAHIFGHINKEGAGAEWLVQVSYLEIYQENIRDLLVNSNEQKHLELKEHPETGVYRGFWTRTVNLDSLVGRDSLNFSVRQRDQKVHGEKCRRAQQTHVAGQ